MSILGAVVRTRAEHVDAVAPRLSALPGVDLALNPGDGRMVVVIEDARADDGQAVAAASTLGCRGAMARCAQYLAVYEYSGEDAMQDSPAEVADYRAWRGSLNPLK